MIDCIVVGAGGFIGAVNTNDKHSGFFYNRNYRRICRKIESYESQVHIISKGWNLRRFYHVFLLCIGDGGFDESGENASGGPLYRAERDARSIVRVCRTGDF